MTLETLPIAPEALPADFQENLDAYARQAAGAYADNTVRSMRANIRVFTAWCAEKGHAPLPATPDTVAAFVDDLGERRAPATIDCYLASIAHLHKAAGAPDPTRAQTVRLAVRRLKRAKGTRQHQAHGITSDLRARLTDAADTSTLRGLRDRALLAVGYDTLMRRCELAALDVGDLAFADDGSGTALVRRSKTDQEGEGQLRYLAPDTCAMLQAWLSAARIDSGPLFRTFRKSHATPRRIDPRDVARTYKRLAAAAGVREDLLAKISGHSTRIGACQDLVAIGTDLAQVMRDGGWQSPKMISRYAEHQHVRLGGMARLAATQRRG